ncbi:MAG: FHA domain-containing protein, partial [Planctomycetota bacterium]|nr:FHA domain-containing protein [Planctomycetota bacterium]
MLAYLVIRDGTKWSDVFRLVPGRTITVGRAPTNQIVINEEQASRHHAEIYLTEGHWVVRDLESRNGTAVGNDRLHGDYRLQPGDVIRISKTQLAFVHDLSHAYEDSANPPVHAGQETAVGLEIEGEALVKNQETDEAIEPTTITHRRGKTRYLQEVNDTGSSDGMAAAKL